MACVAALTSSSVAALAASASSSSTRSSAAASASLALRRSLLHGNQVVLSSRRAESMRSPVPIRADSAAQPDDLKVVTKKGVYFKTDSTGPVRFFCTSDGKIDFSRLGYEFKLHPKSIQLNGTMFPLKRLKSQWTWEEIEEIFKKEGEPVGTKEDPVIVSGKPPVPPAKTQRIAQYTWEKEGEPVYLGAIRNR